MVLKYSFLDYGAWESVVVKTLVY